MNELVLADRWLLWALIPLFLAWSVVWWILPWLAKRRRQRASIRYSSIGTLQRLRPSRAVTLRRIVEAVRIITVALLIMAMARPQTGRKHTVVRTEGIDIVSGAGHLGQMQALDLDADRAINRRRNRLEVARLGGRPSSFRRRKNDQIGLVVFGNEAFTQCPLTLDHGFVADLSRASGDRHGG